MRCVLVAFAAAGVLASAAAAAEECRGRAGALGTTRVITVDASAPSRIGSIQYEDTLPLAHKEVVLTFDDGPLPAYTARILEALAAECVKATFFMVGRMARAYPDWVRRAYNAGHTIATHSNSHPRFFDQLDRETAIGEIEDGIAATKAALGDGRALAPFFRFPGLRTSHEMERYLATRGMTTWSADAHGDDWRGISAANVVARLMGRLERKGRGVVLLHDIQAVTALALPDLLRQLKVSGYRIVHAVPAASDRPNAVPEPAALVPSQSRKSAWPVLLPARLDPAPELPVPSALSFGFPDPLAATVTIAAFDGAGESVLVAQRSLGPSFARATSTTPDWPPIPEAALPSGVDAEIPAPSAQTLGLAHRVEPKETPGFRDPSVDWQLRVSVSEHRPAPAARVAAPREREAQSWQRKLNWFH